jgi:hypothetical protein
MDQLGYVCFSGFARVRTGVHRGARARYRLPAMSQPAVYGDPVAGEAVQIG